MTSVGEVIGMVKAGGWSVGGATIGATFATIAGAPSYLGALIGGTLGLVSVIAKGYFNHRQRKMELTHEREMKEMQVKRYKRLLDEHGINTDTES